MIDFRGNAQHPDSLGAVARAVAASGAENLTEFLGVDGEFVENALALPARLPSAWIVTGSMGCEHWKLARVPYTVARVARRRPGVNDVKTMAGWTGKSACAAAYAGQRMLFPEWILKVPIDEFTNGRRIEPLFWTGIRP